MGSENLARISSWRNEVSSPHTGTLCKHKGGCTQNALRGFLKLFSVAFLLKYGLSTLPLVVRGKAFKRSVVLAELDGIG